MKGLDMDTCLLADGTKSSVVIQSCQVCGNPNLESVLFLGFMPPVNTMRMIGQRLKEEPSYPAELLHCSNCDLVQLGLSLDPKILFPPEYPYTSGTTRILRENFEDLHQQACRQLKLKSESLVVDIGSNDGTLLSYFKSHGHRVLGVEPTDVSKIAVERGIPTEHAYFGGDVASKIKSQYGPAHLVTATNCFAHIENVHAIVDAIVLLLSDEGVFVSESHYLIGLLDRLQYDTIYHEHLRYYSLNSLKNLLEMHGLQIFNVSHIPTHGGSIRVYAARAGTYPVLPSVREILAV